VAFDRSLAAARRDLGAARAELLDECLHPGLAPFEVAAAVDAALEERHRS
jgi:hypothetical protein